MLSLHRFKVAELTSQEIRDIRRPKKSKKIGSKSPLIDTKTYDSEIDELKKKKAKDNLFIRDDKLGWGSKANDYEYHGMVNQTVKSMFASPLGNIHPEIKSKLFK